MDWLPVPELVGFVPDVGVGIDWGIGLEAVVEGKAAGMVIMAMGDGDAIDALLTDKGLTYLREYRLVTH